MPLTEPNADQFSTLNKQLEAARRDQRLEETQHLLFKITALHRLGQPLTDEQRESISRDEVRWLNKLALGQLMQDYGFVISLRVVDQWRPCLKASGVITGLEHVGQLTILATDGVVAYFEIANTREVFYAHIQYFSGEVKPLYSVEGKSKPTPTRKKAPEFNLDDIL